MRTYYWIVAAGNIKKIDGVQILNAETMHVCDTAIQCIEDRHGLTGLSMIEYRIGCCAGNDGMSFTTLGALIAEYLGRSGIRNEKMVMLNGKAFNTVGEARAFAHYVRSRLEESDHDIQHVTIIVRWWHALRAYILLRRALRRIGVDTTRIKIDIRFVSSWDVFGMLRECLAWPLTWIRMIHGKS